jgi:Flp pilus assembly protein TadD
MTWNRMLWLIVICIGGGLGVAQAGDLRIPLPKPSRATPVQSLNREGVEALRKNQYEKAKEAFFKAYLLDPNDPFTLNNLGYISELAGDAGRAQRFYSLAARQSNGAAVGLATSSQLEGKSFQSAVAGIRSAAIQIDRANFEAIYLFSEKRSREAEILLQKTLPLDSANPFTLNNLGVAKEMQGDFEGALQEYSVAANLPNAKQRAVVTSDKASSGRPIREVASQNAQRVRARLKEVQTAETKAALLNFRGVSAVNRNDPREAAQYFLQAYQADPNNAFSLNNAGYVAEMDGDLETAESFYENARHAPQANATVGLATRTSAEGLSLSNVADNSDRTVAAKIEQDQDARRRESGPIRLKRRDGQPVTPSSQQSPNPNVAPPDGAPTNAPPDAAH